MSALTEWLGGWVGGCVVPTLFSPSWCLDAELLRWPKPSVPTRLREQARTCYCLYIVRSQELTRAPGSPSESVRGLGDMGCWAPKRTTRILSSWPASP